MLEVELVALRRVAARSAAQGGSEGSMPPAERGRGCRSATTAGVWTLAEGDFRGGGPRMDQAAAASTIVSWVGWAVAVANLMGFSVSCLRRRVTKSKQEGRWAPRLHFGKSAYSEVRVGP